MTPRTAGLAFAVTFALAASAAEAGALVAFRPKATAAGGVVTLGDVAEIHAADAAETDRLSAIILGPAPAAGQQTPLAFETVRSRLMAAGVDLAAIEFSGQATVLVSGPATGGGWSPSAKPKPAGADVRQRAERAVAAAVARYLAARAGLASVVVEPKVGDAEAAAIGAAEVRGFDVSGGAAPWTGPQTFTLRFLDTQEQVREARVGCVVSLRPSILAARHAIPKGQTIRPDDLVWKKAESEEEASCATDPAWLIGRETRQPIRSGQGITLDAVRVVPLVRTGQFVTVTSRRPGITIQRVMKAKADGAVGEVVALLTLEDHKTLYGRVTGLQEAEAVDGPAPTAPATGEPGDVVRVSHEEVRREELPAYPGGPGSDRPRVLVNPSQPLSVPSGGE